jgi:uncharacterized protein (DUF885 family)
MQTFGHVRILIFALSSLLLAAAQPTGKPPSPAQALHALFDAEWEYGLAQNPVGASFLGDKRWNDRWEDAGLANAERQYHHNQAALKKLLTIDRARLSPLDQVNHDMFRRALSEALEEYQLGFHLVPVNQRGGIQTADTVLEGLRFTSKKDYEDWIARLRAFPVYMDQTMELMREGMRRGIKYPKVIMQRIPAQVDRQLVAPEQSGFFAPFRQFPGDISPADRQRLAEEGRDAIATQVIPAFRRFREFFVNEYLPAGFDDVGVWQWPNGKEAYAFTVRKYTTTAMTPEEIHEIGLAEVKRIRAEMETIKTKVGFKGSMQEFFTYLRTDPKFFCKTPEELLLTYRATAKRIDPNLVKVFRRLPRTPYGVEPIPDIIAPDTTAAYYQPLSADGSRAGTYAVNLYKPESRPKWEMMALSLHESVPGHHLQAALAAELGELPSFRRYGYYSAFGEGWGLYSESLGEDMGLYDDPYDKFGQLTYEMWRAVRLVVDTGMHLKHWSRRQAIDYFMENAAKTEQDVVNEIDRYIYWPGQALSYKIGELKILGLRRKAKQELGERFDLKQFHEVVLSSGAVPLDILENNVNAWIATAKAARKGK